MKYPWAPMTFAAIILMWLILVLKMVWQEWPR